MPPSASSLTFGDLKKLVAERAMLIEQDTDTGIDEAMVTQPAADKIERALRDGVTEFYRSHDWAWCTRWIQFTLKADGMGAWNIDSDPSRYLLPDWVESLPGNYGPVLFKGPASEPGGELNVRAFDDVTSRQFRDPTSEGNPMVVGAEYSHDLRAGMTQRGGVEVRFWPIPDDDYIVGCRARIGPVPFVKDDQRGQWPAVHDLTVADFAVVELFKHDQDPGDPDNGRLVAKAEERKALSMAISIERDNKDYRPQELGSLSERDWPVGRRVELFDYETNATLVSVTRY